MFENKLPLPIGEDFYKKAVSNYFTIDKTLMIKDVIDAETKVSLFTRPRRFGKTLNMDMLRVFFETTPNDNSVYFKDKLIWQQGEKYTKECGKYPVIWLTFKDVKCDDWEASLIKIRRLFADEYERHQNILNSLSLKDKELFQNILMSSSSVADLENSICNLCRYLADFYGEQTIIIIDEYDTVIQKGYTCGFYNEAVSFMRNLFSGAFKNNPCLKYGFMTGILRISKESIFSGLNNLKVYTVLDDNFSEYFGFTKDDIHTLTEYYECEDKFDELCDWYDGYRFGDTEIFNPWSVINYIYDGCVPKIQWANTSSNDVIYELLSRADNDTLKNLNALYENKPVSSVVNLTTTYMDLKSSQVEILSFLLITGYLKVTDSIRENDENVYNFAIPNREIRTIYRNEILNRAGEFSDEPSLAFNISAALRTKNLYDFEKLVKHFLQASVSYYDSSESFYHGLILGLLAFTGEYYNVKSNREAGYGRFDIALFPLKEGYPGYVFEFKVAKSVLLLDLKANEALRQINNNEYAEELANAGIKNIIKVGMAFKGKRAVIKSA